VASDAEPQRSDRSAIFVGLALAVATLAVFARACNNEFVNYDDPQYVTDNPHVLGGLSLDGIAWAFTSTEVLNWHPLTWLSLQFDRELYDDEAWGFHLTNVLLHTANVLLLLHFLWRATKRLGPATLVAALFALHPLHVESVAWVAERKDVLSTLFGFLSLVAYLNYVERPNLRANALVALAMALSLMAKPMWVTLPGLLLLLDWWPLARFRRERGRWLLVQKLPLLALSVAAGAVTLFAQQSGGAVESLEKLPLGWRAGNSVASYVRYLGMAFWPSGLAPFYPHPRSALPAWQVAAAALMLACITALVLFQIRRRPYLAVGWFWYLGMLAPVIGLIQVGDQALADRYTYVPLIGIFIMLAFGFAEFFATKPIVRRMCVPVAALAVLACALLGWRQIGYWHDSRSLWTHTLNVTAGNYLAENNLGGACLAGQGTPSEAEEHLRKAIALKPDNPRAWARLGAAVDRQGKLEEAIACYSLSLELAPDQPSTRNNLAVALAKQGKMTETIAQLQEATRLAPEFADAFHNLAGALDRAGRLDEAIAAGRRSVRLEPRNAQYHRTLARLLQQHGDMEEAAEQLRKAESLRSRNP